MAMRAQEALLTRLYEAFNRQDIEAVLVHLHPDVDWPDTLDGGRRHGRQSVRDYWVGQFNLIRSEVSPIAFEHPKGDGIVVTAIATVFGLDGKLWFEGKVRHHYRFKDDLIVWMDIE